jgi:glycosyltransferase involved in cell wall biosynthesis
MIIAMVLNGATGGATESALDLARVMRRRGRRVVAVLPPGGASIDIERVARGFDAHALIALPWWNRRYRATWFKRPLAMARDLVVTGARLGSLHQLVRFFEREHVELVHTNTALTIEPALAAEHLGLPHVWHLREQLGEGKLFRFWLPDRLLCETFVRGSQAVIANAENTAEAFVRVGLRDRVDVIPNGVELSSFPQQPDLPSRVRFGAGPEDVLFGMCANLTSRWKEHTVFIHACAAVAHRLPSARFVLLGIDPVQGDGGGAAELSYARELHALVDELGLRGRFVFAGYVRDVPTAMSALQVLVHPAREESFGRVMVEAMAAGLPVIGPRQGGAAEIVIDGVTGMLIAPGDMDGFADNMVALGSDTQRCRLLGQAGRARAREVFLLDAVVDRVEAVYERARQAKTQS